MSIFTIALSALAEAFFAVSFSLNKSVNLSERNGSSIFSKGKRQILGFCEPNGNDGFNLAEEK